MFDLVEIRKCTRLPGYGASDLRQLGHAPSSKARSHLYLNQVLNSHSIIAQSTRCYI